MMILKPQEGKKEDLPNNCIHEWKVNGDGRFSEKINGKLTIHTYKRYQCKKCGAEVELYDQKRND